MDTAIWVFYGPITVFYLDVLCRAIKKSKDLDDYKIYKTLKITKNYKNIKLQFRRSLSIFTYVVLEVLLVVEYEFNFYKTCR